MKAKRQMRIIELVSQNVITSQEELCRLLAREGIKVTQATISRDIKELNMIRVPAGTEYKYALCQAILLLHIGNVSTGCSWTAVSTWRNRAIWCWKTISGLLQR